GARSPYLRRVRTEPPKTVAQKTRLQGRIEPIRTAGYVCEEVTQICNLLYRRIPFCQTSAHMGALESLEALRIRNRRRTLALILLSLIFLASLCASAAEATIQIEKITAFATSNQLTIECVLKATENIERLVLSAA